MLTLTDTRTATPARFEDQPMREILQEAFTAGMNARKQFPEDTRDEAVKSAKASARMTGSYFGADEEEAFVDGWNYANDMEANPYRPAA